jgi:TRAP-type transport system periplasmic protein
MRRKNVFATLGTAALLVMLIASLVACSTPAPTQTAPTTAAPTATAPAKVTTMKMWIQNPETAWQAGPIKKWIAALEATGQIKIQPFWNESLMPGKESINGLKGGLYDISCQLQTFNNPGEFPVSDVSNLPFMATSLKGSILGLRALYEANLMPEYVGKGFKLLDFQAPGMQYVMFKSKQIDTFAGLSGLKIRSQTPVTVDMIKSWGATPVALASADVYMSLDRGVIDGSLSSPGFMAPFKFYEVAKYFLDQSLYGGNMWLGMYQKTWDSLTPDLQKKVVDATRAYTDDWIEISTKQEDVDSKDVLKKNGVTFYQLKAGELDKFKAAAAPQVDAFVKKMNDAGLQGQKIVDTFRAAQPK